VECAEERTRGPQRLVEIFGNAAKIKTIRVYCRRFKRGRVVLAKMRCEARSSLLSTPVLVASANQSAVLIAIFTSPNLLLHRETWEER